MPRERSSSAADIPATRLLPEGEAYGTPRALLGAQSTTHERPHHVRTISPTPLASAPSCGGHAYNIERDHRELAIYPGN